MVNRRQFMLGCAGLTTSLSMPNLARSAQRKTFNISRQLGLVYIPLNILESQNLIEKHAAILGLKDIKVTWRQFSNSSSQQDALISGGVDVMNTGTGPLLFLWDKTGGQVKGINACSSQPVLLVSRDPRIKTLSDFKKGDRIAVPTVKISTQAILLQMAARQLYGDDNYQYFDPLTVQLGHADALISLKNKNHEVKSHFGLPPYSQYELAEIPEAHIVAKSSDIIGGPLSQAQYMARTKFADENPLFLQALMNASAEAAQYIQNDITGAIAIYKKLSHDQTPTEVLQTIFAKPDMMRWELEPQGTMKFAEHLHKVGSLKTMPASWKDYYFDIAHNLPGS